MMELVQYVGQDQNHFIATLALVGAVFTGLTSLVRAANTKTVITRDREEEDYDL